MTYISSLFPDIRMVDRYLEYNSTDCSGLIAVIPLKWIQIVRNIWFDQFEIILEDSRRL